MTDVILGPGILDTVDWNGLVPTGSKALVLADANTYAAAGESVAERLLRCGIWARPLVLETQAGHDLEPDADAVFRVLEALDPGDSFLVSVGSGTITDIGRFTAHRCGLTHIAVGTAASMDGYTSSVSPLVFRGFKKTHGTSMPRAVIADSTVMAKAPRTMTAAGFGDLLGKYTANADWIVASLAFGEARPPGIWETLDSALRACRQGAEGLASGDAGVVGVLAKGLLDSGTAISMVGNSRPASGAEHLLSHAWEMMSLRHGMRMNLHGAQVGVATVIVARLYERVLLLTPGDVLASAVKPQRESDWRSEMARVYGDAAAAEAVRETGDRDRGDGARAARLAALAACWDSVRAGVGGLLPDPHTLDECLCRAGAPRTPGELDIPDDWVMDACLTAHNLRNRYTVLNLAEDLGILRDFVDGLS